MNEPLVTVVTPTYNCAEFIGQTIASVRTQTFSSWEHLLVDDCSTDKTADVILQLAAHDARIQLIRQSSNEGPAVARNRGIAQARGRYLAFLDSDDLWSRDKLARQVEFMQAKGAALSYTNYDKVDETATRVIGHVVSPDHTDSRSVLRANEIACSTAMIDLSQTGKVYMPLIRKRQDWGLWFTLVQRGFVGRNVGRNLAQYRVHAKGISSNKANAMLYNWRFYRDVAKLSLPERVYRITAYALIGMRRYRRASRAVCTVPDSPGRRS